MTNYQKFTDAFFGNPVVSEIKEYDHGIVYTFGIRYPAVCAVLETDGAIFDFFEIDDEDLPTHNTYDASSTTTKYETIEELIFAIKKVIEDIIARHGYTP